MKTTEEKNRMIAEFMEVETTDYKYKENAKHISELKYHTSWSWLMPVLEKISKTKTIKYDWNFTYTIKPDAVFIFASAIEIISEGYVTENISHIQTTYNCVIQFIEWYNENK